MVPGTGTLLNMATVLVGSGLGVALGGRLPERTRTTVTDALGLVTLVIGALNVAALSDAAFRAAVGDSAPLLVVLGALLVGGIAGACSGWRPGSSAPAPGCSAGCPGRGSSARAASASSRATSRASLVFVVGPLAILGPLSDGLGRGIDQLALKSDARRLRRPGLRRVVRLGRRRVGAVGRRRAGHC